MVAKERPILFSAPMVCAILDDRKTMTRRIVKPQPVYETTSQGVRWYRWRGQGMTDPEGIKQCLPLNCPYGQVGDRLWVRETWQEFFDEEIPSDRTRAVRGRMGIPAKPDRLSYIVYRADGETPDHPEHGRANWKPSIFMPRWASRITLEITGVRVERLNDIILIDAMAEGVKAITKDGELVKYGIPDRDGLPGSDNIGWPWREWCVSPVDAFQWLWQSINGPDAWEANPWVWVISFKRVSVAVKGAT